MGAVPGFPRFPPQEEVTIVSVSMIQQLDRLQNVEQGAINEFKDFLLSHYPERIELIELFGSKARGDGDKESDIDLLIVVDKEDRGFDDQMCEMMNELCLKYNVLISPVIFEKKEFELYKRVRAPILLNIEKEGMVIWKMS